MTFKILISKFSLENTRHYCKQYLFIRCFKDKRCLIFDSVNFVSDNDAKNFREGSHGVVSNFSRLKFELSKLQTARKCHKSVGESQ